MADIRRDLWIVLRREYRERVRTKTFVLVTTLGPFVFLALMFVPLVVALKTRVSPRAADVVVVDATGRALGDAVAAALQRAAAASAAPRVVRVDGARLAQAESAALADVRARRTRGYLVLDTASLAGGTVRYVGRNAGAVADMGIVQQVARRALLDERLRAAGVAPERAESIAGFRVSLETTKVQDGGRTARAGQAGMWLGFAMGFALYGLIALYGVAVLRSVTEEKESRAAEIVLSSITPDALVGGKVLGVGLVALTQLSVWVASGVLLSQLRGPLLRRFGVSDAAVGSMLPAVPAEAWGVIALALVLGFLLYAALFAMLASTVSTQADAQQAMMPALAPLILSISVVQPTLINPDATLSRVASWFPLTAPIIMPVRVLTGSPRPLEVAASLVGVALATVAVIWLAARVYRVAMLMYGKRPTFGELARLAREGGA